MIQTKAQLFNFSLGIRLLVVWNTIYRWNLCNEGECAFGAVNADGKCEGVKTEGCALVMRDTDDADMNMSGPVDCQSSCDLSQPSVDDNAGGYGDSVKFFCEESSQGIDADDECGDSSSSDDDWQEVEGLCESHDKVWLP